MEDSEVARDFNGALLELTDAFDALFSERESLSFDFLCECGCGAVVAMTAVGYATRGGAFLEGHGPADAEQLPSPAPAA